MQSSDTDTPYPSDGCAEPQANGGTPQDSNMRALLSNEWHARPNLSLPSPMRCTHIVCLRLDGSVRDSRQRFSDFCQSQGQSGPGQGSRHHTVRIGNCLVKWEGHTEVDSYTILVAGSGEPAFSSPALDFLERDARERLLDSHLVGVHVEALRATDLDEASRDQRLRNMLGSQEIYGGSIGDGDAELWSSFRLDADGFQRLVIIDKGLEEARLARRLQGVLDLESYRMLAMLGLPEARAVMNQLNVLEPELDHLMSRLAQDGGGPAQESQLQQLTALAARIEHLAAANVYRFAAARAYSGLVERRIEEIDERKLGVAPRYSNFLLRSLLPAMRTCDAAERRLHELAQRTTRATQLLDSMVDIERKKQNQTLLEGMAERSGLQLRLQQSVEGFSIFAISYYAIGIIGYLLKSANELGIDTNPELFTGLSAPLVVAIVWWSVRNVRRRLKP